jgi:hypothetical protein
LPNFHADDAESEAKESNQKVEAPIKVYQCWKILNNVAPTSIKKSQ